MSATPPPTTGHQTPPQLLASRMDDDKVERLARIFKQPQDGDDLVLALANMVHEMKQAEHVEALIVKMAVAPLLPTGFDGTSREALDFLTEKVPVLVEKLSEAENHIRLLERVIAEERAAHTSSTAKIAEAVDEALKGERAKREAFRKDIEETIVCARDAGEDEGDAVEYVVDLLSKDLHADKLRG